MAYCDYRHCDVCDAKAFYDANLNYDDNGKLERVGAMKVLCDDCAKTHEVVIKAMGADVEGKENPAEAGSSDHVALKQDILCGG